MFSVRSRRWRPALAALWAAVLLAAASPAASPVLHGNVKSHVFHRPGCRYYNCKNCVMVFQTRQEALEAGYRPCKVCRP